MTIPRFIVARSAGDWVILHDNVNKRLAVMVPRDTSLPQDKAEAAAVRMAEVCAEALNLKYAEFMAQHQKEMGK